MNWLVQIEGAADVVLATHDEAINYLRHIVAPTILLSGRARILGEIVPTDRPVSAKLVQQNDDWVILLMN